MITLIAINFTLALPLCACFALPDCWMLKICWLAVINSINGKPHTVQNYHHNSRFISMITLKSIKMLHRLKEPTTAPPPPPTTATGFCCKLLNTDMKTDKCLQQLA